MTNVKVWGYRAVGAAVSAGSLLAAKPVFAQINANINLGGTLGSATPEEIIETLLNWVLGFLALVAVILILVGGFMWMTSGGGEEKVKKAKKLLYSALIGLVIIMAAWGLTLYAFSILGSATGTNVVF